MSEYTPTTEEVSWAVAEHLGWDAAFPGGAFDRWLAEERRAAAERAYEQGRNDERHDCDRYTEHQQGRLTDDQLKRDLRRANPYREKETKA